MINLDLDLRLKTIKSIVGKESEYFGKDNVGHVGECGLEVRQLLKSDEYLQYGKTIEWVKHTVTQGEEYLKEFGTI